MTIMVGRMVARMVGRMVASRQAGMALEKEGGLHLIHKHRMKKENIHMLSGNVVGFGNLKPHLQ